MEVHLLDREGDYSLGLGAACLLDLVVDFSLGLVVVCLQGLEVVFSLGLVEACLRDQVEVFSVDLVEECSVGQIRTPTTATSLPGMFSLLTFLTMGTQPRQSSFADTCQTLKPLGPSK